MQIDNNTVKAVFYFFETNKIVRIANSLFFSVIMNMVIIMLNFFRKLLLLIISFVLLVVIGFCGVGYWNYKNCIDDIPIQEKVNQIQAVNHYTPLDKVSNYYKDAIVAIEDHRFYSHHGIDYVALVRVTIANIAAQEILAGGSTITQQLAKNMYFDQSHSMTRKISEAFAAHELEKHYDKNEILELYINSIYYGDGYYGIYDASMGYFGVDPLHLTLAQASMLAGLPQAPSAYALSTSYEVAARRQVEVLNAMLEYGYINKEQYMAALAIDLRE